MHMLKLIGRGSIFLFFAVIFIADAFGITELPLESMQFYKIIKGAIWVIFVGEMILRFFPSSFESMGCQKQFARNYKPRNVADAKPQIQSPWRTDWKKRKTVV